MIKPLTQGSRAARARLDPLIRAHNEGYVAESADIAVNQDPESGRVSLSLKPGAVQTAAAASNNIPDPPASGNYVLTAQDGQWVLVPIVDC